ncbi:MAG: GNAT family N-acetyltransferase [Burkholderiaceae bacterium]|jgi:GNAT superfamily N-acetyltransferase|nr:GNAT family N-acetyltransferase [Burkholderiales bacterium]MCE2644669.1 GNAT family N-acetyltransferase [Burkholderiaceae bacterium]
MNCAPPRQLFTFGTYVAVEAVEADLPAIAAFYAESPEYLRMVEAREPAPQDALEFLSAVPPPELSYRDHYALLLRDACSRIDGLMMVATDLPATGVWHLSLMMVATRLHGRGLAQAAYGAYEAWARASGACWLRLGVVEQNVRARRFWQRQGYVEIRRREGVAMGDCLSTVLVMWKPAANASLGEYLAAAPRDRPDT